MTCEVENTLVKAECPAEVLKSTDDGNIVFSFADREVLKLCLDGRFFVWGRLVTTDVEAYRGFKAWLESVTNVKTDD